MIKETITYIDYNGIERKEEHYFHMNETEIMDMQLSTTCGLDVYIKKIVDAQDLPALVKIFKELVLKAYGEKSPDGRSFIKEDEDGRPLCNKFKQTEAYSTFFMKLARDSEAAIKFVNGIMPSNMTQQNKSDHPANK